MTQAVAQTFQFALVSPEADVLRGAAIAVQAPGSEGDFGVRAGHMNLVAGLRPGVLAVQMEGAAEPARYFVAGGFADVSGVQCTILAEQAVPLAALQQAEIANDISLLEARLAQPNDDITASQLQADLALAREKLKAAQTGA